MLQDMNDELETYLHVIFTTFLSYAPSCENQSNVRKATGYLRLENLSKKPSSLMFTFMKVGTAILHLLNTQAGNEQTVRISGKDYVQEVEA